MALGALEDLLWAYIQQVTLDISQETELDSISPDMVGSIGTDLANILRNELPKIVAGNISAGPDLPTGGEDKDLYYQSGLDGITIHKNTGGVWNSIAVIPIGLTSLVDGVLTGLRVSMAGFVATVSSGSWIIQNGLFRKANQSQFTLGAAHATLLRYDLIYANKNNEVLLIAGTPGEAPVAPDLPANTILVETITVPSVASGKAPFSDFAQVDISGKADITYVDQQNNELEAYVNEQNYLLNSAIIDAKAAAEVAQEDIEALEILNSQQDLNVVHRTGAENVGGAKNFTDLMAILNAINDNNPVALGQYFSLVNTARYWRIQRKIPSIRIVIGLGKAYEFLKMIPTNNYVYCRMSIVTNGTVKSYEFTGGYDMTLYQNGQWFQLVPDNIYSDRPPNFELDIRVIPDNGPTNSGIEFRIRNTGPTGGLECTVDLNFSLALPSWQTNFEQFNQYNLEYDLPVGPIPLYGHGKKLTLTDDGLNYIDTNGQYFAKSGESAAAINNLQQQINVLAIPPSDTPYTISEYLNLSGEPENLPMTLQMYLDL